MLSCILSMRLINWRSALRLKAVARSAALLPCCCCCWCCHCRCFRSWSDKDIHNDYTIAQGVDTSGPRRAHVSPPSWRADSDPRPTSSTGLCRLRRIPDTGPSSCLIPMCRRMANGAASPERCLKWRHASNGTRPTPSVAPKRRIRIHAAPCAAPLARRPRAAPRSVLWCCRGWPHEAESFLKFARV